MDEWLKLAQAIILVIAGIFHIAYVLRRWNVYEHEQEGRRQQREDMQKFQRELITALEALREKAER